MATTMSEQAIAIPAIVPVSILALELEDEPVLADRAPSAETLGHCVGGNATGLLVGWPGVGELVERDRVGRAVGDTGVRTGRCVGLADLTGAATFVCGSAGRTPL